MASKKLLPTIILGILLSYACKNVTSKESTNSRVRSAAAPVESTEARGTQAQDDQVVTNPASRQQETGTSSTSETASGDALGSSEGQTESVAPVQPTEMQSVTLGVDQPAEVRVGENNYSLSLSPVIQDSRCPAEVTCFLQGGVVFSLSISSENTPKTDFKLKYLKPRSDGATDAHTVFTFEQVNIKAMQVVPESPVTDPTQVSQYSLTLAIEKG